MYSLGLFVGPQTQQGRMSQLRHGGLHLLRVSADGLCVVLLTGSGSLQPSEEQQ